MTNLKYLFTAELQDGSTYKQNKEDASVKEPPVKDENGNLQGRSCMFDIQEDVDNFRVKKFTLVEQKMIGAKMLSVDLSDGHFEINGVPFTVEGDRPLPTKNTQFKLIFFRVRRETYISPAGYMNPQRIDKFGSHGIQVTNSKGEVHTYKQVAKTWYQDDVLDNGQTVKRFYVQPIADEAPIQYMVGWQTTIAGKNYQQVVLVD